MKKLRFYFTLLLCGMFATQAFAQDAPVYETTDNDFQFRGGWTVSKRLSRKFDIEWREEFRIKNTFGDFDRLYSEIGAEYKALDWLRLTAKYTHILINHDGKNKTAGKKYWQNRHRATLGATFIYKTHYNWRFSLRELVQTTFIDDEVHGIQLYDEGEKANPKWMLKSRLKAEYAFRHIPVTPYVSVELVNTLNAPKYADGQYIENVRTAIGMEYRFDSRSSIDVYYRFDYGFDKDINVGGNSGVLKDITEETSYTNIIGVNYKIRF